ncbi:formate dehydrogenase subunit alpha [Shewanella gaetbuli]
MITLNIDGTNVSVDSQLNLLKAAHKAGIIIPSLCDPSQENTAASSHKQHCNLCMVQINNNDNSCRQVRACETPIEQGMQVITQSTELSAVRKQALTNILADHFADCEAPCQQACPAGVDIQSYLYHIAQGNHHEAVKVIKQTLPLPLSIGRVCPAFCEAECRRGLIDEPVAIRQLKRHAADLDLADAENQQHYQVPRLPATGKKVAIIGSGPAGLSAGYYLSNQGHEVCIFESMPKAGGWLRYGIPEYRLPKDILDKEINLLTENGLHIKTNTVLGQDIHLNALTEEYDAVCLAIGAQKAVPMNYPGSDLAGCYLGVDYLKDHCTNKSFNIGKKVAVIGGGNTAIDCARTAVRDGCDVTLIYRRTREEMPAEPYEIHEAEVEGVKFHLLTNPIENIADNNGRVSQVVFDKMQLGEPDASGRRSPKATGETFTEQFDTVIAAVSQTTDLSFLQDPDSHLTTGELALSRWNTFIGCEHTMSAGIEKLFVIGDSRRGPATAVAAIGDGRKAAIAIDKLLHNHLSCELHAKPFNATKAAKTTDLSSSLYPHETQQNRQKMPELSALQRLLNYSEVELGFTPDSAMQEAARCLECACQANTDCKLRDYATDYNIDASELNTQQARHFAVDKSSPFIHFDANRCISCGKCVEVCEQQSGHCAIKFERNSYQALPSGLQDNRQAPRVGFSASMRDSDCVQCGNCIQVCPTGALVDARDKRQGQTQALQSTSTICTYCGVGCRIDVKVDPQSQKIVHVEGNQDSEVNQGMLCVKGRFGFDFLQSEQRLTTPLIRQAGKLVPTSWHEALEFVANKLKDIRQNQGNNSFAALSSAKATNEENYLLQKFVRSVMGTNNIDHCARLCHSSTVSALQASLGSGAMTNDIPSIAESDVIFIIGSDTENAHPIIASKIKQAVQKGAKLVVADPKKVTIADHAHLFLCHKPGTDVVLINAIMAEIIRHNWQDSHYIAARTQGYEAVKSEVLQPQYSLETAAKITGVKANDIAQMAKIIGTASKTAVYYAMGITQHTSGHDNVTAIANLQLLCGNIGLAGAGINPLRGQSNVQGACDMGALPNYYTGYQQVTQPEVQAKFEQHWGCTLSSSIGLTATEVMHAISHDEVKALYVMGENPVLSDPDQAHVLEALNKIPLLVVQDIFLTETAQLADVVLPAAAFAEKQGHFTNTERRVQQLAQVIPPPGEALADWQIIQQLANLMGANWQYANEQAIWHEITQVTPQYAGISWARLAPTTELHPSQQGVSTSKPSQGIQWPCPDEQHPGTPILHQHTFTKGIAVMTPVSYRLPAELPDNDYPYTLSTGRLLEQFHTGTLSRKTQGLNELGIPKVMISVFDAEQLNVNNGDMLTLSTRRGSIDIQAFVTKRAQVGVLFLPFHFVEAAANKLTNNALDPVAKIPEFKICAVNVTKTTAHQASNKEYMPA